jgi:hypothetical protein
MRRADPPTPNATDSMSVTAFFDYLGEHNATTGLAKALGEIVMLRTCGARRADTRVGRERLAS